MARVYFASSGGRIKIGTAADVAIRFKGINSMLAEPLVLIGDIEGGRPLERAIHAYFKSWRLTGEWFEDCDAVRNGISIILGGGPGSLGIDAPSEKSSVIYVPHEWTQEERLELLGKLARLMWPNDPIRKLAEFSGYAEDECEKWLTGAEMAPMLVVKAFGAELVLWMFKREP